MTSWGLESLGGGGGERVKRTEHLFQMLCTFEGYTTYLIQFQINYILYPTDHVYKKICKRSAETPFTVTTSPLSHVSDYLPHLPPLLIHTRWHTHYTLYLHRYTPLSTFPCPASTPFCERTLMLGNPPVLWIPPPTHTYTLDLYCLVQSVSLVNTGDYSPCIVNPDG